MKLFVHSQWCFTSSYLRKRDECFHWRKWNRRITRFTSWPWYPQMWNALNFYRQMFALQPLNWNESKSSTILHLPRCLERFVFPWLNRAAADYGTSPKFTRFWFIFFFFFFWINQSLLFCCLQHPTNICSEMESYDWLTERLIGCTQNAKLNFKLECLSTPTVLNYLPFPTASSKLCWKLFSFFFLFSHRGI